MLETLIFSLLAGVLGGLIASGLRLLHLEMEWHAVRKDLRRYYAQGRADRAREIEPHTRSDGRMPVAEILRRARERGLMLDQLRDAVERSAHR